MFNREKKYLLLRIIFLSAIISYFFLKNKDSDKDKFITYTINPQKHNLQFFWKDDSNNILKSITNLKNWLAAKNKKLFFAMNGGMYKRDNTPQGLYIEKQKILAAIDTTSGQGNFYMKPNGIFYLNNNNEVNVCRTDSFKLFSNVKFATQSGPMLVIDGNIHSMFKEGSTSLNIRNGVGILTNNNVLFVMSKQAISFYDFALYFKKMGCKNALYLDGFVSRTYLPEKKWMQMDGNFGVMIGEVGN